MFSPVAELLQRANETTQQLQDDILTDNQRAIRLKILELTEQGSGHYNLYGAKGAGKSTLAKYIVIHEDGWAYAPWLPVKSASAQVLFVDNVPSTRTASRRAREIIGFDTPETVITISNKPVPEAKDCIKIS